MWLVVFGKQAVKDVKKLKSAGLGSKAEALVEVVRHNPFGSPPAYEALVGSLSGMYSRRINLQHRFVYEIERGPLVRDGESYEGIVRVTRMWTRYDRVGSSISLRSY